MRLTCAAAKQRWVMYKEQHADGASHRGRGPAHDCASQVSVAAARADARCVLLTPHVARIAIIKDIGYYYMAQRFPKWEFGSDDDYKTALELHHKTMVCAVKAKQSTDVATSDALDAAIEAMAALPMYA